MRILTLFERHCILYLPYLLKKIFCTLFQTLDEGASICTIVFCEISWMRLLEMRERPSLKLELGYEITENGMLEK